MYLVAGVYFYVVGVDIFIRNDDYVNRRAQDSPPPLSWLGQERGERMQSDYRAVSRNISLQRLNLARIIIILVLLPRAGLAGN